MRGAGALAGLWIGAAAAATGVGCGDRGRAAGLVDPAPGAAPQATVAAPARRPTRRYYLGRTTSHCEVYSVDGDVVSAPLETPCPLDLVPGERLRVVGRTCTRESTDADRQIPVVCPDPLTNLEKVDRKRAARGPQEEAPLSPPGAASSRPPAAP